LPGWGRGRRGVEPPAGRNLPPMVASSQGQSHAAGGGRPWSYVTRGVRTNTSTSTDADASSSAVDAQAPGRRRNPAHHDGDGGGDGGVDGDGRNVRDERAVVGWGTGARRRLRRLTRGTLGGQSSPFAGEGASGAGSTSGGVGVGEGPRTGSSSPPGGLSNRAGDIAAGDTNDGADGSANGVAVAVMRGRRRHCASSPSTLMSVSRAHATAAAERVADVSLPSPSSSGARSPATAATAGMGRRAGEGAPLSGSARTTTMRLAAGAMSSALVRTLLAPFERVKLEYLLNHSKLALGPQVRKIFAAEGVRGFWRGNGINLLRVCPYKAINFAAFDAFRAGAYTPHLKP